MPNVKVIPPELLHPGECYLGRHKKGGIYVFRYLGENIWSSGMFTHKYPSQVPDSHPYSYNTDNVDAFLLLFTEETVEEACQSAFKLSLKDVSEEITFLVSLQNKPVSTKYKIVNSIKPLYRVA